MAGCGRTISAAWVPATGRQGLEQVADLVLGLRQRFVVKSRFVVHPRQGLRRGPGGYGDAGLLGGRAGSHVGGSPGSAVWVADADGSAGSVPGTSV